MKPRSSIPFVRLAGTGLERIAGVRHPFLQTCFHLLLNVGELGIPRQIVELIGIVLVVEQDRLVIVPLVPPGIDPALGADPAPKAGPPLAVGPARPHVHQINGIRQRPAILAGDNVGQIMTLHTRRDRHAAKGQQRGHHVHTAEQRPGPPPALDDARVTQQERDVDRLLVRRGFGCPHGGVHPFVHRLAVAVTAQMIAMIGRETDDRILGNPQPAQCFQQSAHLHVERGDIAVVLGDLPAGKLGHLHRDIGRQIDLGGIVRVEFLRVLLVRPVRRLPAHDQGERRIPLRLDVILHELDRLIGLALRAELLDRDRPGFIAEVSGPIVLVRAIRGKQIIETVSHLRRIRPGPQVPLAHVSGVVPSAFQSLRQRDLVIPQHILIVRHAIGKPIFAG